MENLRGALPLQLHCTQYYPYIDDDCVYVVWLLSFKNHPPTIGWNDNNKYQFLLRVQSNQPAGYIS